MTDEKKDDDIKADKNRGQRAKASVGEVTGSGSGAGGGGGPEEYDIDPVGGGGAFPPASPPPFDDGADAPSHGSR